MAVLRFLALVALLVGAGCAPARIKLPTTAPSIAGTITAVDVAGEHLGSIRVEAVPGDSHGAAQAVVRIAPDTDLVGVAGVPIMLRDLEVGRRVRVWFRGPVRESYPVQADAATVELNGPGALN